jgi:hypothetical protein
VICADETPIRVGPGPKTRKKYLLVARTDLLTYYFLGDRSVEQPPARMLLECLRDREHDVLRFLSDLRVPPTSNGAEQDLRPAKTQQKISGRLRSEQTTRHRYAIRGYLSTAAKHGISIFPALRDALAGTPGCHLSPAWPEPAHAMSRSASKRHACAWTGDG